MEFSFRSAEIFDLENLFLLENQCFKSPWKKSDLEYELTKNPINKVLICLDNDKIIGFIDYMITFNSATISQIGVDKAYRNKGIASKLLNLMEESFPKDGDDEVETVTLEVRESNKPALNLYLKDGYEIVVKKPHYYDDGEDAIYMVKRLLKWH